MPNKARRDPPYRAEHVGSLLRPKKLTHAFREFSDGRLPPDDFVAIQDESIREVVQLQQNAGLSSVTDGEFRRASYWSHFVEAVDGLGLSQAIFDFHSHDDASAEPFLAPCVEGPIVKSSKISAGEFEFLRNATDQTPKITMPSPPTMHFWARREGVRDAYGDRTTYFADLAKVYRQEISELGELGATYIQIDEVPLAMLCDPHVRQLVQDIGEDPLRLVDDYIELINASISSRPQGMTVGMHLCRGNFKGKWLSEGGYDWISERLFQDINVNAFFLEYDTPRAGDFEPLQNLPDYKVAILGLITTKSAELEDPDELCRRIDQAARYVPLERLAVSPQCGFSSAVSGNPLTEEDEIKKLELVVSVAQRVWG